jgi:hypothetical protein
MSANKKVKVLTEDIMHNRLCFISDFSEMTPGAARLFANHLNKCDKNGVFYPEEMTDLGWLQTVSDLTAKELSICKAIEKINLSGLSHLSDGAAMQIAKINFFRPKYDTSICLDNVRCLSDKAMQAISKFKGKLIKLGVEKLSDKGADSLSKFKGKGVEYLAADPYYEAGIEFEYDDKIHGSYSRNKLEVQIGLLLNNLNELTESAAKSLSKYQGAGISLMRVHSLSDDAAVALSKFKGFLFLDGLESLSDVAAKAFSKKKISLMGLKLHKYSGEKRGPGSTEEAITSTALSILKQGVVSKKNILVTRSIYEAVKKAKKI